MKSLKEIKLPPSSKLVIKLGFTALAVYVVLTSIDLQQTWKWLQSVSIWAFIAAFLLYNVSQWVSTWRLIRFFSAEEIGLSFSENLKLYYRGMFYNLLLPGSIGGDGYKMFWLKKYYNTPLASSLRALVGDRASGAVILLTVSFLIVPGLLPQPASGWNTFFVAGSVLTIPLTWTALYIFAPTLGSAWLPALIYSLVIHSTQLMAAILLFTAFDIPAAELTDYAGVFLVSSLFSAIPFTVGGIGMRDVVFVFAADFTAVNPEKAIAFTLLFALIGTVSSLPGGLISDSNKSAKNEDAKVHAASKNE